MTVILKIMSNEPLHDSDPNKKFELIELASNEVYYPRTEFIRKKDETESRFNKFTMCIVRIEGDKRTMVKDIDPVTSNYYELDETGEIIRPYILINELAILEENKKLWVK